MRGRHLVLLASPDLTPGAAAAWLIEQGVSPRVSVLVGSALSLPEEKVWRGRLGALARKEFPWLSLSVFINPGVPSLENDLHNWRRWRRTKNKFIRKRRPS